MTFSRLAWKIFFRVFASSCARVLAPLAVVFSTLPAFAQDSESIDDLLLGVWNMELRVLRSFNFVSHQEEANISITEKMPDGTYRVLARVTTRIVADVPGLIDRPGCSDKKECIVDDATEGEGRLVNGKLYIDWIDETWIDDIFTILGDRMEGDDGNGPIRLYKVSKIQP